MEVKFDMIDDIQYRVSKSLRSIMRVNFRFYSLGVPPNGVLVLPQGVMAK